MIRVGIIGATGYAGAELVRILCGHPDIELTILTSRQYAGVKFDEIFPSMTGSVDLVCEALSVDRVCDSADVVIYRTSPQDSHGDWCPNLFSRQKGHRPFRGFQIQELQQPMRRIISTIRQRIYWKNRFTDFVRSILTR